MNQYKFAQLINDHALLDESSGRQLHEIVGSFPYFQSAQILYFLSLIKNDNINYHSRLKMAAAYSGDRGLLKQYVEQLKMPEDIESGHSLDKDITRRLAEMDVIAENQKSDEGLIEVLPERTDQEEAIEKLVEQSAMNADEQQAFAKDESKPAMPTKSKDELIEQFIENAPRIIRTKADFFDPDEAAKSSRQSNEEIVSETLAHIYHKQGKTDKAIKIYQRLSTANPEKSSYFAALIEKITQEQNLNT
jgi:tetratricopeptide (TPR) repeat protein